MLLLFLLAGSRPGSTGNAEFIPTHGYVVYASVNTSTIFCFSLSNNNATYKQSPGRDTGLPVRSHRHTICITSISYFYSCRIKTTISDIYKIYKSILIY